MRAANANSTRSAIGQMPRKMISQVTINERRRQSFMIRDACEPVVTLN